MISSNLSAKISFAFSVAGELKAVVRIVSTRPSLLEDWCWVYGRILRDRVYAKERKIDSIRPRVPSSSIPTRASHRWWSENGSRRTLSYHRWGAEELVRRSAPGFAGRRPSVAGRAKDHRRALGSALGIAWRGLPVCATDRHCARRYWACADCDVQVGRLGASAVCFDVVRCDCGCGWLSAAALHHETHGQGAHLGFHPGADNTRYSHSILGCAAGSTAAGCGVCIQGSRGSHSQSHAIIFSRLHTFEAIR